jgi:para-nitrobenzyl esterase
MMPADIDVAARFQASVLRFVTTGVPDQAEAWPRFELAKERLAIFGQPFHIVPLNDGARFRVWAELSASSNDKKKMREAE